jgi:regulator of sigma E protease
MIGPLVFFHELGHYLAAKAFGVKCERFAVGMGPRVASFRHGETEFSIRALPLGGYVTMLGAMQDEAVDVEDAGRALTDKPIWQRMIVYLAGPVMNLLLAVPIFWVFFMGQAFEQGPEVGMVLDGTPAAEAGFLPGDRVVSIDGDEIKYFADIRRAASSSPGEELEFEVVRGDEIVALSVTPEAVLVAAGIVPGRTKERGQLGIVWSRYPSYIHVGPESAAEAAGLRTFDHVIAVNGEPVSAWIDLRDQLASLDSISLTVRRLEPTGDDFAMLGLFSVLEVALPSGSAQTLGLAPAQATIFAVEPGTPAAAIGLLAGDRVIEVDGRPVTSLSIATQMIRGEPDTSHDMVVERSGEELEFSLTPAIVEVVGEMRAAIDVTYVGIIPLPALAVDHQLVHVGIGERVFRSLGQAVSQTIEYIFGFFLGVLFLIIGAVDSSNLGGPLMIADVANRAGADGILTFVRFMGVISINLGIVNLLPVPGLDGGHLTLLTIEGIKREPLSFRARQISSYVGVVCLVLLMLFAFKNDVERYWADIAMWLNS